MKTFKLFTVDVSEGHRGEPKLYVNEGIRGNISSVLQRLQEGQKLGDHILDICSLRNIHGEFTILRTSHRDADNNAVRDILNSNSGVIRIRLGEILSFKIFDGPFVRVWVTFENNNSKVSWSLLDSGKVDKALHVRLEQAVRIREGKTQGPTPEAKKPHSLENAFIPKEVFEEWSPSQPAVETKLHVVESEKPKGRKTSGVDRRRKALKLSDLKTGTQS